MIVAMRAVLIALLIIQHVLSECLLALFADECHLRRPPQFVCLCLCMALGTVIPLLAAWRTDRYLGVENVLANALRQSKVAYNAYFTGSYVPHNELAMSPI